MEANRHRISSAGRPLTLAAALAVAFAAVAFTLGLAVPAGADKNDFNFDFAAAAPGSYDPATGGGAYDDGTNGVDIVDSLAAGSVFCGDIVSFVVQVVVDSDAVGAQTLTFDYTFDVEATNGDRAGHIDIVGLVVNYGDVGGDGTAGADAGISDDGGSTISSVAEGYDVGDEDPPSSTYPATSEELNLVFDIDDLEASESVVFRIDVLLGCDAGSGTGLVQAHQNGVSVGGQAVPGGGEVIPLVGFGTTVTTTSTTTTTQVSATSTLPVTGIGDAIRLSAPFGLAMLVAGLLALGGAALVGGRRRVE